MESLAAGDPPAGRAVVEATTVLAVVVAVLGTTVALAAGTGVFVSKSTLPATGEGATDHAPAVDLLAAPAVAVFTGGVFFFTFGSGARDQPDA